MGYSWNRFDEPELMSQGQKLCRPSLKFAIDLRVVVVYYVLLLVYGSEGLLLKVAIINIACLLSTCASGHCIYFTERTKTITDRQHRENIVFFCFSLVDKLF